MRNIIIFGSTGMLGSYCTKILQKKFNIIEVNRNTYDILENNYEKLFNILKDYNNSIVINCAGAIPQRYNSNDFNYFIINSLFPKFLEKICLKIDLKFIHISTNCVFNYESGLFDENTIPNESHPYGLSKILGEPEKACVIRTSIIGEEISNKKSFLEWVLSNKNGEINGYENYYWNGCTCPTLVRYIEYIIENNIYWYGVKHFYSDKIVSKYELAVIINNIYNLNIKINPIKLEKDIHKTLTSIYENNFYIKPIEEQIKELKEIHLYEGNYDTLLKCRCCNNTNLKKLWNLKKAPLAGGFLNDIKNIKYERYYPLTLIYCERCCSAFVKEIVKESKLFKDINNSGYFYYSSEIPTLVTHFKELYSSIKNIYDLNNKNLLEIGCNDGVFLNNFKNDYNIKNIVGIDPSQTIQNIKCKNIQKINDYFNTKTSKDIVEKYGKFDYIIACNCLAHIDNINEIFKNIKYVLNENGIIILEVHYIKTIFEEMNFDFIYHEHMSYYSINGIYNLCKNNDLFLENVENISNHGGSIRVTIKNKTIINDIYINEPLKEILKNENITPISKIFLEKLNLWKSNITAIIDDIYKHEKQIAGYGASGRTNIITTFLNYKFDYMFDDSNYKIDNYVPIHHTKILSSEEIYKHNIKTIFILAWPYSKYIIKKHEKFVKNGGKFIIILPVIQEITIENFNDYVK